MFKTAVTFFKGLSPTMQIVVIVILIIVLYLLYRKFSSQLASFFQSRKVTYQPGETAGNQGYTAGGGDPTKGKSLIEELASNIYKDIDNTPYSGHVSEYYEQANQLSDSDLLYLANYYKTYLSKGTSLWSDMDSQYYHLLSDNVASTGPDDVKTRLVSLGVK